MNLADATGAEQTEADHSHFSIERKFRIDARLEPMFQ
jgi:hypothetical protein